MNDNKNHTDIFYWAKDETEQGMIEREGTRVESLEQLEAIAQAQQDNGREIKITMHLNENSSWQAALQALKQLKDKWPELAARASEALELMPYIEEELENPKYQGKTMEELAFEANTDENGEPAPDSLFMIAMSAAREAREADRLKESLPQITVRKTDALEYPLDKPNSILWNLLEEQTDGQITFNMLPKGNKKTQALVYYAIDFEGLQDNLPIIKRLTPFDKRVYIAASALYNAGNKFITLTQIHNLMGNTKRPSSDQLEKIDEAITKMSSARIYIDNKAEADALKGYPYLNYEGSLLPMEQAPAMVNGKMVDSAIHLFREPPLVSFAKKRKQVTTINAKLLQSPISKTPLNLSIDDYLIERISQARNRKSKRFRMLYKTIFEKAGITTKKQKERAPAKIFTYLDYYKTCETFGGEPFIRNYTKQNDGVTIYF